VAAAFDPSVPSDHERLQIRKREKTVGDGFMGKSPRSILRSCNRVDRVGKSPRKGVGSRDDIPARGNCDRRSWVIRMCCRK
jgi:hypothetical protein